MVHQSFSFQDIMQNFDKKQVMEKDEFMDPHIQQNEYMVRVLQTKGKGRQRKMKCHKVRQEANDANDGSPHES